jgi:hypothetical protein
MLTVGTIILVVLMAYGLAELCHRREPDRDRGNPTGG